MSPSCRKYLSRRVHVLLANEESYLLQKTSSNLHARAVLDGLANESCYNATDFMLGEEEELIQKGLVDLSQVPLCYFPT